MDKISIKMKSESFLFQEIEIARSMRRHGAVCTLAIFSMLSSISSTKRRHCGKVVLVILATIHLQAAGADFASGD